MLSLALVFAQDAERPAVVIEVRDGFRHITASGLPDHSVGTFTSRNDVVTLTGQNYQFRVTLEPRVQRRSTPVDRGVFGVAINGVPFDGRAEERFAGANNSSWYYDTLRNARALELDMNNAHAQRGGAYHYHGVPVGLINRIGKSDEMRLIGWAADGFPIYDQFGYEDREDIDSPLIRIRPSYRVKAGNRPTAPFGTYDGSFVQDWEYDSGFGELDECNGRTGKTPEFPSGTYYYVVTEQFPGVPRLFRGTPDPSFTRRARGNTEG